ncbi:MAG TPA: DoxX family protein [Acidimicrobiia bacterium]|nr:DoxX family protein [Acidimicrobiia bacterium]
MRHNTVLWVLQWVYGVFFIVFGVMHLTLPEGLPDPLSWMYDLDDTVHTVSGVAEILGGVGLILPSLTRIAPVLSPLAALGLIVIMLSAIVFHAPREEWLSIGVNVIDIVALGYIAYGRLRLAPIPPRGAAVEASTP